MQLLLDVDCDIQEFVFPAIMERLLFKPCLVSRSFAALVCFIMLLCGEAQANEQFDRWVRQFRVVAIKSGIKPVVFDNSFSGVTFDPTVIPKARNQPEFVRPVWSYLDNAVSTRRVENGRQMAKHWKNWLDVIEAQYGVSRYTVLAIWGIETSYGKVLGNKKIVKSTIRSLASLAFADKKRRKYARKQLIASLKIIQNGDVRAKDMTGSWAGAMGHTQFIPTTYLAYAVDITGDGKRDVWHSIPDALASTAAYLNRHGWETGKTWGYEVRLPRGFNYELGYREQSKTLQKWQSLGIRRASGIAFPRPMDEARLYVPAGSSGPAFLLLKNFRVIKRYNNANAYALAVGHLSDRIRGDGDFIQRWYRKAAPLTASEKVSLQLLLKKRGYAVGKADGKIGPRSRRAIRDYQSRQGMIPDGYASKLLLKRLQ